MKLKPREADRMGPQHYSSPYRQIACRFDPAVFEELSKYALANKRSVSNAINHLVAASLNGRKSS